jgi:hypothetical protein
LHARVAQAETVVEDLVVTVAASVVEDPAETVVEDLVVTVAASVAEDPVETDVEDPVETSAQSAACHSQPCTVICCFQNSVPNRYPLPRCFFVVAYLPFAKPFPSRSAVPVKLAHRLRQVTPFYAWPRISF